MGVVLTAWISNSAIASLAIPASNPEEPSATSRGLLLPSRPATTTTTTTPTTSETDADASRGFLLPSIGKWVDKKGNELVELCYRDSMCAGNVDGRTACYRGRCVECTSSVSCTDLLAPVCDPLTRRCVQCTSSSDCQTGVCGPSHTCVECDSNSRCTGRGTYIEFRCSTYQGNERELMLLNTCAECVVNSDCPYRMTCGVGNACVCTSDAQCDAPQPYCFEGRCQACAGGGVVGHGVCSTFFGSGATCQREPSSEVYRCVECTGPDDCGGAACVDGSCSCVTNGCAVDGTYCDRDTQRCVACLDNKHCLTDAAPYCSDGQCVECTGDSVTCRKETTVGTVACSPVHGTCEPLCDPENGNDDCRSPSRPFCDDASGHCAPCRNDGDCDTVDPTAPFCLADPGTVIAPRCVQCREPGEESDCEAGLVCNQHNQCSSCHSDAYCPVDRPLCSASTRSCVACDDQAGLFCPKERPICSSSGICLGCETDLDCGSTLRCDPQTSRCELCLADADCAAVFGDSRPYCSDGTCLECRGSKDCSGQFPVCSDGVCVQCTADGAAACGGGGVCDPGGRCVDCLADSQCWESLPHCVAGRCAQCRDDSQCTNGSSCVDGVCMECDPTATTLCTTIVESYYQSCSPGLTCESRVAIGSSVARVLE